MISTLCSSLGGYAKAFVLGWDDITLADIRLAQELKGKARAKAVIGAPRLRAPQDTTADKWQRLTCKQLDTELRARGIKGRSKAKRKADKIALLRSAWL